MRYRRYSLQFKEEACRLAVGVDHNPARAAKELGVSEMTLRSWMKQRKLLPESKERDMPVESDDINVVRMQLREAQRRIRQLEMEKDILKKATAFFAKEQP